MPRVGDALLAHCLNCTWLRRACQSSTNSRPRKTFRTMDRNFRMAPPFKFECNVTWAPGEQMHKFTRIRRLLTGRLSGTRHASAIFMKTLRICYYLAPALLVTACGSRQTAQPMAQQGTAPAPQQAAQPITQQYAQPIPQQPVQPPPTGSQPIATTQEKPAAVGSRLEYQRQEPYEQAQSPVQTADRPERQTAISIPAGTLFDVRLEETLDTQRNRAGDRFSATLRNPIVIDGRTVLAGGTRCEGHLVEAKPSGRFKGRAVMSVSLDSFDLNGRRYTIRTTSVGRQSGRHRKRNWILIGGGSGLGSALGAIAGGPAGALIGAGAGGAAGTAGAAITGKKNVRLPVETVLTFQLRNSVAL